jgi:hypothetical protein
MHFCNCAFRALIPAQCAALALFVAAPPAHALSLTFGELVITEFMSNPVDVSDSQGEWFELYNAGSNPIELNGLTVRDTSTSVGTLDFGGSFLLAPGGYASLARSSAAGFTPDGLYNSIALNNGGDELHIRDGAATLASLVYGSGEGFAGASTAIDLGAMPTGTPLWFADTENLYGLADTGTPGVANVIGGAFGTAADVLPSATVVPLPAGVWLLLSGLGMLLARR